MTIRSMEAYMISVSKTPRRVPGRPIGGCTILNMPLADRQEKKNRPRCEEGPPRAVASCALLVYNVKAANVRVKGVEK